MNKASRKCATFNKPLTQGLVLYPYPLYPLLVPLLLPLSGEGFEGTAVLKPPPYPLPVSNPPLMGVGGKGCVTPPSPVPNPLPA